MKSEKEISEQIHNIALQYSTTKRKPNVAILQPRRNIKEIPAQQLQNWNDRHIMIGSAASYHAIDGNPVDVARNYLIEKALEDDVRYILFVDEDTVLPYDAFIKLEKTSKQFPDAIIVGVYYFKFGEVMMSVLDEDGHWILPDITPNTGLIHNLVTTGMGCALIPLHLIKRVKSKFTDLPLFCIVPEKTWGDDKIEFMGEDTWFYTLAQQCGIEIIGDTSVHCLHMELATGKYEAHPNVNLNDYHTNIPITGRLTMEDYNRVNKDYNDRICKVETLENNS
jgi:hypothetical protein